MIVDKQPQKRTMIRSFLNLPGITFCECDSGDDALARVRKFKPDWITLDMNQLETDGFQSAAALREAHPPAQMVIVTGCNETDFNKLYNSVGRSALFKKKTSDTGTNRAPRPEGKTKFRKRTAADGLTGGAFTGMTFAPST
ncbi:MAG: response regulator [Limisphaerales bacterium]